MKEYFRLRLLDVAMSINLASAILFASAAALVQDRPLAQNTPTIATLLNFVECDLWDGRPRIPFMPISLQSGTDTAADVEITTTVVLSGTNSSQSRCVHFQFYAIAVVLLNSV